jgi:hypothetical protein
LKLLTKNAVARLQPCDYYVSGLLPCPTGARAGTLKIIVPRQEPRNSINLTTVNIRKHENRIVLNSTYYEGLSKAVK